MALTAATVVVEPAQAMQPYDECMADTAGIQTWGCYDLQVAPNRSRDASVDLTWTLNTSAEGFNNGDWRGGIVMTRWPVEGQWKKYPSLEPVQLPGPHEDCNDERISDATCYRTFGGANGTLRLDFGPKMAGYVYEVYSHDYICSTDQNSCGPSGGSVDRYVFVLKAFQYKDRSGKTVKSASCPPSRKRTSPCLPAAIAKITDTIGGGDPVPPPGA